MVHNSDVTGRIDVFLEVFLDLRDVHGLSDGGVSVAHYKQSILQRVLTDHYGEEHTHLIIPADTHQRTVK